jgi:hypothetical protein
MTQPKDFEPKRSQTEHAELTPRQRVLNKISEYINSPEPGRPLRERVYHGHVTHLIATHGSVYLDVDSKYFFAKEFLRGQRQAESKESENDDYKTVLGKIKEFTGELAAVVLKDHEQEPNLPLIDILDNEAKKGEVYQEMIKDLQERDPYYQRWQRRLRSRTA